MNFVSVLLAGYLVGSIPTAYLFVRYKTGIDIRRAGSGNVGAFNTFDVTNSKSSGIVVGLLDALKGFLVTATVAWILRWPIELQGAGMVGAVLGHNYPVWLRFKGGRGLATAAGGMFAIGLMYTLVWCIAWFVVYNLKKDIHIGNVAAIVLTPIVVWILPARWVEALMISGGSIYSFQLLGLVLSIILLASHADVLNNLRMTWRQHNE